MTYQAVHLMIHFEAGENATSLTLIQPDDVLIQRVAELQVFFFRYAEAFVYQGRLADVDRKRPLHILASILTRVSHAASTEGLGVPLNGEG